MYCTADEGSKVRVAILSQLGGRTSRQKYVPELLTLICSTVAYELTCLWSLQDQNASPQWNPLRKCHRLTWMAAVVSTLCSATEGQQSARRDSLWAHGVSSWTCLTLLSRSNSFLSHSKSLYLLLTLDSLTRKTGRFVWKKGSLVVRSVLLETSLFPTFILTS